MDRKGQDLSIGTLILIVLGIIVLVLLILGFSLGWSNLWSRINIFGGGASINDVVAACNLAVTSNNVYGYCEDFKKIKSGSEVEYVNCLDERVDSSLQTKITNCPDNYKDKTISSITYCNKIKETFKGTVKINNIDCVGTKP